MKGERVIPISVAEDIVPIAQFKAHASEWFRKLGKGKSTVVITSNGHTAGVLLSPLEYDRLTYTHRFLSAIKEGMADSDAGRTRSTEEVLRKFHGED